MRMLVLQLLKFAGRAILCGVLVAGGSADGQINGQPQSYETTFYPSGKFKIEAYVYKPEGTGPFPVVIYNHGSRAGHEREERPVVYVGEMLMHSGYVVIVPERRGYGKSDGPTFGETIGQDRGPRFVARVREEADDVLAVVEFIPGCRRRSARAHDFWKGRLEDLGRGPAAVLGDVSQIALIGKDAKGRAESVGRHQDAAPRGHQAHGSDPAFGVSRGSGSGRRSAHLGPKSSDAASTERGSGEDSDSATRNGCEERSHYGVRESCGT
jgi:hypothetical protein